MKILDQTARDHLATGLARDMAGLTRQLDALRALAYREGMEPLYEDDQPHAGPWDQRSKLLYPVAEGLARMDMMRSAEAADLVGEEARQKAELFYLDMVSQSDAMLKSGFLIKGSSLVDIAHRQHSEDADTRAIIGFYERKADEAGEHISAEGATTQRIGAAAVRSTR